MRHATPSPLVLRRAKAIEDELETGRRQNQKAELLDNFEFTDEAIEARSIHVLIEVEGRPPLEVLTYKEESIFAGELIAAHRVALRRWVLGQPASDVLDVKAFQKRPKKIRDLIPPSEADAADADALIADLDASICDTDDLGGQASDDDQAAAKARRRGEILAYFLDARRGEDASRPILSSIGHGTGGQAPVVARGVAEGRRGPLDEAQVPEVRGPAAHEGPERAAASVIPRPYLARN